MCVCVDEIRNGVVIARQRKDLQIKIAPCKTVSATLEPEYLLCKKTKNIEVVNLSASSLISSWFWGLSNSAGSVVHTSTNEIFNYTFADTGIYHIKLAINRGEKCKDSTTSVIRVYPGVVAGFNFSGICYLKPFNFTDISGTAYGKVNSWHWSFGTGDSSNAENPTYKYSSEGV